MKLLLAALTVAGCASAAPEAPTPVAPAQAQAATAGPGIYEGTYALQAHGQVIDLRVWVDAEGRLNGEMVDSGQQTTFRPTSTEHRFLHAASDNVWFWFTVEDGRATSATMGQGDRQVSGPRKP